MSTSKFPILARCPNCKWEGEYKEVSKSEKCPSCGDARVEFVPSLHNMQKELMRINGWKPVKFAGDMGICPDCMDEPYCSKHKQHFSSCSCVGPTRDDMEYVESGGILYYKPLSEGQKSYTTAHWTVPS